MLMTTCAKCQREVSTVDVDHNDVCLRCYDRVTVVRICRCSNIFLYPPHGVSCSLCEGNLYYETYATRASLLPGDRIVHGNREDE